MGNEEDLTDYVLYGIIILLIIVLIWLYLKSNNLQTLYNSSLAVQSQLNAQVASSNSKADSDNSQIVSLKAQIDQLNDKITSLQPKADELAQYKSIISGNLYASLKASNTIFGNSTNPKLLQNIADIASSISFKVGPALCEYAQILAKALLQAYDTQQNDFTKQACNPKSRAALITNLNGHRGEFTDSQVITIIAATFDLFQAYFCSNQSRDNLVNIIKALVNVICNPSSETKQLYSAFYKQLLLDLDNNYKNGSPKLVSDSGIRTEPKTIKWGLNTQTTPGYHNLSKIGDPVIDGWLSSVTVRDMHQI